MNALYRPGPMDYIPDFIDRKWGRKPIEYDIPIMEKYLKDTYGITVYQEQVMLLSRLLADFTRGESDALRKAMGKKLRDKLDHMKPKFISGGQKNGHDPKVLQQVTCHLLFVGGLSDGFPQGQLSGRIHGGGHEPKFGEYYRYNQTDGRMQGNGHQYIGAGCE